MVTSPTLRHASGQRRRRLVQHTGVSTVGQCFDIEVDHDASGWVIRIPEIDAETHAQRRSAVSAKARECIAARTGIPIGYIAVVVRD